MLHSHNTSPSLLTFLFLAAATVTSATQTPHSTPTPTPAPSAASPASLPTLASTAITNFLPAVSGLSNFDAKLTEQDDEIDNDDSELSDAHRQVLDLKARAAAAAGRSQHNPLLHPRQGTNCPYGFSLCSGASGSGVCCREGTICSADSAAQIGCCPVGAVCTGTAGPPLVSGTVTVDGGLSLPSSFSGLLSSASQTVSGLIATGTDGFIITGDQTVAQPGEGRRVGVVEGWGLRAVVALAGVVGAWV